MRLNFLFYILLAIAFMFSFYRFSNRLAITEFDEVGWISDSYFTQFYLHADFRPNIWDNTTSSDEPMLARYAIGIWLYPSYLIQKTTNPNMDYTQYLINNGFFNVQGMYEYEYYKETSKSFTTLRGFGAGFPDELKYKLGNGIEGTIDLVYKVRLLSQILLTATLICLYIFLKKRNGNTFSLIFIFIYGFSTILLKYGLLAQSEALFIFLFNGSLIYLYKFIYEKQSNTNLAIFSILSGLCFSTKLNGIMLYFIFIFLYFINSKMYWNEKIFLTIFKHLFTFIILISIFTLLNPYTFHSPLIRIYDMFMYRQQTASEQAINFVNDSLPNLSDKLIFISKSFVSNFLFIKEGSFGIIFETIIPIILLLSGMAIEISNMFKHLKLSQYVFFSFISTLIITIFYLNLAWDRYLIHLLVFIAYYQTTGFVFFVNVFKRLIKKLFIKCIN